MKATTVLASLAAIVPAAMADDRFPTTGPFTMTALAFDAPEIHYSTVQANGGYLTIGTGTNSSCGDVNPTFNGGNGALSLYANDSSLGQQVYVDISGAAGGVVGYVGPLFKSTPPSSIHDEFVRAASGDITTLTFENKTWLACPQTSTTYLVFAAAQYDHEDPSSCITFEIRTDKADSPQSCTYY